MRRSKGRMLGLLEKARTIRSSLGLPASGRGEFVFDPDSGISRADQKDIFREIETVATANRITVGPEAFAVRAAKRGVLFPVLVNLLALIALAGGLAFLYLYFQRGETQLAQGETGTITAEGKLIEQVKKDSAARLAQKDQQITQIQDRLAEIDRQRQDLQSNVDAKVRERETQLKAALAAELEAEKARLEKQGLSQQEVSRRLSALEARKNVQSEGELAAFRAQAETDRQKTDENLRNLQAEFNASLARTNQERQQLQEESKKREADLQAQLEQKTQEAESAQARSARTLAAMQSQKREEDLVSAQLVGLYSVVKADIAGRDYPGALAALQGIRDYVNRPDVAGLPAIQQRRDVDLFVVDSLASFVQVQLSPAGADTRSPSAAAGQISEVRDAVSKADAQARAGNIAEAEKLYDTALAVIPEIAKSYGYFTTKARDAEAARQQVLRDGLARAEAAYEAGRYTEMIAAYKDALAYLPETSSRLDRTLANIEAAGSQQPRMRSQAEQARDAAPLLSQADAALAQGRPADAISRYLTILQRYPQSPQATTAVQGMTNASAALGDRAQARLAAREKDLGSQVAALQKQLTERSGQITGIKKSIMDLLGMMGDPAAADTTALMAALTSRFGDLSTARGASGDLSQRLSRAEGNAAALQKKLDALAAQNAKLTADAEKAAADAAARQTAAGQAQSETTLELSTLRARLAALTSSYSAYAAREDPLLQAQGDTGLVDAKPYRDSFLRSPSMEQTFPGLYARLRRYDQGFGAAGRSSGIQEVLDVLIEMSKQTSADARSRFLSGQLAAYSKDKDMTDLLKGLQKLLR